MRYLKRFNEAAFNYDEELDDESLTSKRIEKVKELKHKLNNTLFTPLDEKVPLKNIYLAIIVKTQEPINTKFLAPFERGKVFVPSGYETKWMLFEFRNGEYRVAFYPDESSLDIYLKSFLSGSYIDWRNNSIIGYNDINHAEIESILDEYDVIVDEMWGIPISRVNRVELDLDELNPR